jgi:lantibiotic modifying enzyme
MSTESESRMHQTNEAFAWRALPIDGRLEQRIHAALRSIAPRLSAPTAETRADLAHGSAGLALAFAYLSRCDFDLGIDCRERCILHLSHAIDATARHPYPPSLFEGFTGVAWTVNHLLGAFVEYDEDPCTACDESLLSATRSWNLTSETFDLVHGLAGIGLYSLSRSGSVPAEQCASQVLRLLAQSSETHTDGTTWRTPPARVHPALGPAPFYDLGVAHGIPGVIAFLAASLDANLHTEQTSRLLDSAFSWILARRQPSAAGSHLPYWFRGTDCSTPSRSAWCYGDLGVSASLFFAARSARNETWEHVALEIARDTARRPCERAEVVDAGLCHGAMGLAHILHRLYCYTGDPLFVEASLRWVTTALDLWPGNSAPEGSRSRFGRGFLDGAAGLALGLASALSDRDPHWDALLLLSTPRDQRFVETSQ